MEQLANISRNKRSRPLDAATRKGIPITPRADATFPLRIVFSNVTYRLLAVAASIALWVTFNILDSLILFFPILNFYYPIPEDAVLGLVLSTVASALLGIVLCMNIFLFRSRLKVGRTAMLSGSTLGTVSSMCASCSSVGFCLAGTFGGAGIAASAFLSNYQIPLRLIAIALLVIAYYSAHRRILTICKTSS